MLIARSGGYCANPSCRRDLFPEIAPGRTTTIAQLAHIIGQSLEGPRGDDAMPLEARNDGSNVVLLCGVCHDIVDDMSATDIFTPELLRQWKEDHERRVRHGVALPTFNERRQLNGVVRPLLDENYGIWRNLGPESEAAANDPLGEGVELWRNRVVNVIIPNNRRILELLDANRHLLDTGEADVVEDFRVHAGALDLNYNSGRWLAGTPTYPAAFTALFTEDT
jgi:hypothetical protein